MDHKLTSQKAFERIKNNRQNLGDISIQEILAAASRAYVPQAKYDAKLRASSKNYDRVIR
ncbi:hypothetical protein GOV13_03230 [Candidatus Pacearchaeota archaeon]|nr:hypothetical protein [Candidatus Pacearchaeota archaeon]